MVGLWSLVTLSGCAAQSSREMARVVLVETVAYENLVDKKVAAEERYYNETIVGLASQAADLRSADERLAFDRTVQEFQSNTTLRHGQIADVDVRNFVETFLRETFLRRLDAIKSAAEATDAGTASIRSLETHKDLLLKVERGLAQLQVERSAPAEVETWIQFGKEVKKLQAKSPK